MDVVYCHVFLYWWENCQCNDKIGNVENRLITEKYRVKFILLKIFGFIVRTLIRCAILCRKVFFNVQFYQTIEGNKA